MISMVKAENVEGKSDLSGRDNLSRFRCVKNWKRVNHNSWGRDCEQDAAKAGPSAK